MNNLLQVAIGGALGSVARYGVNIAATRMTPGFPLGTLTVNVIGCLGMGFLAAMLALKGAQHMVPFFLTGFLGGFTTFSAFALDSATLWESGAPGTALAYVLVSVIVSLAAVIAGLAIGRGIFA